MDLGNNKNEILSCVTLSFTIQFQILIISELMVRKVGQLRSVFLELAFGFLKLKKDL